MCGIVGYIGEDNPKQILLEGLKRLEYRGYDSAGVALRLDQGGVEVVRAEGRIRNLEKKLSGKEFSSKIGIGHTRWATHGAPVEINAHPHQIGDITLVHNGIIENYMEHKAHILEADREILSDTDSEIVAHLIDMQIAEGKNLKHAVLDVLPTLRGSYAFVIMSEKEPDLLMGVRNGAPLLVGVSENEHFLASDVQAVLPYTDKVIYLNDRQVALCHRADTTILDQSGNTIVPEVKTIHWTPDQMDKLGYKHYMLKEIHEQPHGITNTIEGNIDHKEGTINLEGEGLTHDLLKGVDRVIISACGTARHAAIIGKYFVEEFARVPTDVDFASEFRYRNPRVDEKTLTIFISQSGETFDTLGALREAKERGCKTLSICNVRDSTIARESDVVLYTNAGPEIGVASTKAFTTQLTVLYMLAVQFGVAKERLSKDEAVRLTSDLLRLPILVEKALTLEKDVEQIAANLQQHKFFFYLGRGIQYPIALEGALKLKEISYLHAEGYPGGELKHGPIALVDPDLVTIAVCPRIIGDPNAEKGSPRAQAAADSLFEKMMANVQEVRSRGGVILGFGTEGDREFEAQSDFYAGIPESSWALSPILTSIPLQMFAYHLASFMGTDIDKPRNLAKSVTVE